ncbi:Hsp20/alpha crystallin family protein [Leptolyngbya ohadii]|uniref:Hsp20/alpha crystallin family protein n=1 Tax=Leptolyngbya ohadii TaxID=1962290 RepID=UPI000B598F3A|nr:Hsp20/alpha crystallin family protein [Leptolyngbya ohadii]
MLVRYWNPWREMETLRRQMDRVFDEMGTPSEYTWTPAIELHSSDEALTLKAQLPGMNPKDINVEVTREAVALSGEYRSEQQSENISRVNNGRVKSEFRYGKFHRIVPLPVAVQNNQVQAEYKDGILILTLPRVTEARNQVVKLNLADLTQSTLGSPEAAPEAIEPQSGEAQS